MSELLQIDNRMDDFEFYEQVLQKHIENLLIAFKSKLAQFLAGFNKHLSA